MADETEPKPPVEPAQDLGAVLAAIGSASAPFIYFEHVPTFGHYDGHLLRLTLTASRILPSAGPAPQQDSVIVAHLRMPVAAALALRDAIDKALLLAREAAAPPGGKPN